MTSSPMLLPAVGLVALVAVVLLVQARSRIRAQNLRLRELERLETKAADLERQHHSLGQLMSDYLAFMRDLHTADALREIPGMLLKFMAWLFDPEEAVVLMRRRPAVSDSDRERQLIVASSLGTKVRRGTVLRLGVGELSMVAIAGATLDADRGQGGEGGELAGFVPDLAVPVSIDNENLGVLALMKARKPRMHSRQLLSLFAQSAALAYKNASALNRVRSQADIDALTGVLNKRGLSQALETLSEKTAEHGRPLSVFLFDIDNFKNYNDTNGHLPGDDCLQVMARLVTESIRADDTFGRYGGEEFLVILPWRGLDDAHLVAEKVRMAIEHYEFPFGEKQPLGRVTISGGVACIPEHADNTTDLIEAADRALYEAKNAGRNRVVRARAREAVEPIPQDTDELEPLPFEADDLERIKGIGPASAEKLRDLGVISYRQIAELDWPGIQDLAHAISTNAERILREEWLAQARELSGRLADVSSDQD
ncbi:MAG: diguanylate cyclase [bacterium]|nr:diguanylate cyclase [bacterium]